MDILQLLCIASAGGMWTHPSGSIFFYFSCCISGSGQTGKPGEDVVAIGSMAYDSQSFSIGLAGLLGLGLPGGTAEPDGW